MADAITPPASPRRPWWAARRCTATPPGERTPDVSTVHRIEEVLGVPLAGHLNYRSVFDSSAEEEITLAASGVDLEEVRRVDPERYQHIEGLARLALDRARRRDKEGMP